MSFHNRYGLVDRVLHRFAFSARTALLGAADVEEKMFRRELDGITAAAPVFVTGLPRAGTTILLEVLAKSASIATHTYRDMPFVLCPMMWSRFSRRFQKRDEPRERAHGDGIRISLDSPEAFEEVVWQAFHGRRDRGATIAPWASIDDREFVTFLRSHMRKVIALRRRDRPGAARYASKNNLNIARLPALLDTFDDAVALVPFREPLQHAASLLRQHERFLQLHADDRFARRYMQGIGHYDFGANLKPVDFGGWFADRGIEQARTLQFWLEYWLATYRHLLQAAGHPRFALIGFEALGRTDSLRPVARFVGLAEHELEPQVSMLKPAAGHDVDTSSVDGAVVTAARELYEQLGARCLLTAAP